jgi:hypothetical protein
MDGVIRTAGRDTRLGPYTLEHSRLGLYHQRQGRPLEFIIIYFAKVLLGYRIQNHGVLSGMFHVNRFRLYLRRPTTQYKRILTRC